MTSESKAENNEWKLPGENLIRFASEKYPGMMEQGPAIEWVLVLEQMLGSVTTAEM